MNNTFPNKRQRKVFKEVMDNGTPVSQAMIKAGYKEAYAHNPDKLTESKGWKELVETYLPDELLVKVHLEGLNATKTDISGETHKDYSTRHKYLETAYKVGGKMVEAKNGETNNTQNNFFLIPAEALAIIEEDLKQKKLG